MNIEEDFEEIMKYAHYWNWLPDWLVVQKIYEEFPDSYSVPTSFAYSYLEELIRSTTSEYGIKIVDKNGTEIIRRVGTSLINLAIKENNNQKYILVLEEVKHYFEFSKSTDCENNRNSVDMDICIQDFGIKILLSN